MRQREKGREKTRGMVKIVDRIHTVNTCPDNDCCNIIGCEEQQEKERRIKLL